MVTLDPRTYVDDVGTDSDSVFDSPAGVVDGADSLEELEDDQVFDNAGEPRLTVDGDEDSVPWLDGKDVLSEAVIAAAELPKVAVDAAADGVSTDASGEAEDTAGM